MVFSQENKNCLHIQTNVTEIVYIAYLGSVLNLHDILPIIYLNTHKPAISLKNDYNCSVLLSDFHWLFNRGKHLLENTGNGISKLVDFKIFWGIMLSALRTPQLSTLLSQQPTAKQIENTVKGHAKLTIHVLKVWYLHCAT